MLRGAELRRRLLDSPNQQTAGGLQGGGSSFQGETTSRFSAPSFFFNPRRIALYDKYFPWSSGLTVGKIRTLLNSAYRTGTIQAGYIRQQTRCHTVVSDRHCAPGAQSLGLVARAPLAASSALVPAQRISAGMDLARLTTGRPGLAEARSRRMRAGSSWLSS
ncbi:uncharacterized protein BJX67DRAFT_212710 [Aspergillus lucknowensis]|uniref:Uncharacterized protein n=1 Tax=Aspergillus lucknowensis TaxID=176173 RepID=A0ABR4M2F8_9EURO